VKRGVPAGRTVEREVAAFLLDHERFARVPETFGVVLAVPSHNSNSGPNVGDSDPVMAAGYAPIASCANSNMQSSDSCVLYGDGALHDQTSQHHDFSSMSLITASLQRYASNDGCIEEFGPSQLDAESLHRIAQLDVRLLNLDRHSGNILVTEPGKYRGLSDPRKRSLVPIDHSYSLPSIHELSDITFEWLNNPLIKLPPSDMTKRYVAHLDPFADVITLQRLNFPVESLLAYIISTITLQRSMARELTLYDVGNMFVRGSSGRSTVEGIVDECIPYATAAADKVVAEPRNHGITQFELLQVWLSAFLHEFCICVDVEIDRRYASKM